MDAKLHPIQSQVEVLRHRLLDLSLRNRMLNYRPSRRLGTTVVGESSFELHRMLVEESKKFTFVGVPDPPKGMTMPAPTPRLFEDQVSERMARKDAEEEVEALFQNAALPIDQLDTKLNVQEFVSTLQTKLRVIQREAQLANEELGVNTLYLTLGMLEWEESDRRLRAPLLFVPVKLESANNGTLRLRHDGGDVGQNLPLQAKLTPMGVCLPSLNEEANLLDFFGALETALVTRTNWVVHRDEVSLGFFNYEKFAMHADLSGEAWPEDRKPWRHPDIRAILSDGYPPVEEVPSDADAMDEVRDASEGREVYDADSSQLLAMLKVAAGHSLVIEGPPGTGKSQTITNIISEAVAAGKTVLFVSAKRAALDVVKRRLEEAQLGNLCLDLHDKLANRREFYAEIKRTVSTPVRVTNQEERLSRWKEISDLLNQHCEAVNTPIGSLGLSPYEAIAHLAALPDETAEDRAGRIPFELLSSRPWSAIAEAEADIRLLQDRIARTGVPKDHPFWGCEIDHLDPTIRLDLSHGIETALHHLQRAQSALEAAGASMRLAPADSMAEVRRWDRAMRALSDVPTLEGTQPADPRWHLQQGDLRRATERLRELDEIHLRRKSEVIAEAWTRDWQGVAADYTPYAAKWYRGLVGRFRRARRELESVGRVRPSDPEALLRDLVRAQLLEAELAPLSGLVSSLAGTQWRDADRLEGLVDWLAPRHAERAAQQIPEGFLGVLTEPLSVVPATERLSVAQEELHRVRGAAQEVVGFLQTADWSEDESLANLSARLRGWQAGMDRLSDYVALNQVRHSLSQRGLSAVVDLSDQWPGARLHLLSATRRSYLLGALRLAMSERPALKAFDRERHETLIEEFGELDDFKLRYNRAQVRLRHQEQLPSFDAAAGNLLILKMQCELQRRHKPIRWTMERAGAAVQRIKPIFMMSPLTVAIHLPPELPPFDLVVFDEASQIRPEDALCAMIRGKQTVVVGDTRQMPPTSFFDRVAEDIEGEEDEEVDLTVGREAAKQESILSLMSASMADDARRADLRWHYRSLHPDLISPSNEMFYERRLVVFPSPGNIWQGQRRGLVLHHNPQSVYEPGATRRTNRIEAEEVVAAVLQHLRENPDESLMVAAMNKPQADLIHDLLQRAGNTSPELFTRYAERFPSEPLDVKNLENVQGDERDVVFISVTYGRDAQGTLRQQFGPILAQGGERRLNVLISRARRRCEVFTNLSAGDLRVESNRPGLVALQQYLAFAHHQQADAQPSDSRGGDALEQRLAEIVRESGFAAITGVGTEGCRVDLAIAEAVNSGEFCLGLELDGPEYGRPRSARDRDKLRPRVLRQRGWNLERVWCLDWWQDPERVATRLTEALNRPQTSAEAPNNDAEPILTHAEAPSADDRGYRLVTDLPDDPVEAFRALLHGESPISAEMLGARWRDHLGLTRKTKASTAQFEELLSQAVARGEVKEVRASYVDVENLPLKPRDWSELPTKWRRLEWVSDYEVELAIRETIRASFGIHAAEAARQAMSYLGFRRPSAENLGRVEAILNDLVQAREILVEDGQLRLPA